MLSRVAPTLILTLVLGASTPAFAQEASVVGTVSDETKAMLPGATVTATDLGTGRQCVGVSDQQGEYRLPRLPAGRYKIQVDLSGFTTVVVPDVELLVGQNRTVAFVLKLSDL